MKKGSVVAQAYGELRIEERHRHRYEFNDAYRERLEQAGLVFSGINPDLNLVEFVELPASVHPYFVATQAHPELRGPSPRGHTPCLPVWWVPRSNANEPERFPSMSRACAGSTPSDD